MVAVPVTTSRTRLQSIRSLIVFVVTLLAAASAVAQVPLEEPHSPRLEAPLTILQLNDVYTLLPLPSGAGGLARVATIKKQVAASGRTPLLIVAGDFLSPSVASTTFKGEQMIATLNAIGVDIATLGNHEFDFGDDLLIERMGQARFTWIVSNVVDTRTGRPIGNAVPYLIRDFGPLKVGFIGLCLTTKEITPNRLKHTRLLDPIESAAQYIPVLKQQGANIIVAVTHLRVEVDRAIVERFPDIDVIVGGHEHFVITAIENRTLISKAGSDARFVARIDVNRRPSGTVERVFDLMPVGSDTPEDPAAAEVIAGYERRLNTALDTEIGRSDKPLDAMSPRVRTGEALIGDLVTDAMREETGSDIAMLNSGALRGDRVYPAGPITKRTIVSIHPFSNIVCVVSVPGRVVRQALEVGVSRLPAPAGEFPQVSGLKMAVDTSRPAGSRVVAVSVGGQPLDDEHVYTVALTDYVLNGGDGYNMFARQRLLVGPEEGDLLTSVLERYINDRGEVAPTIEGRITLQR